MKIRNSFILLCLLMMSSQDAFGRLRKLNRGFSSAVSSVGSVAQSTGNAVGSNDIVQGSAGVAVNTGKAVGNVATGNVDAADKNIKDAGSSFQQTGNGIADLSEEVGNGLKEGFEKIGEGIEYLWNDALMAAVRASFGSYPHKNESASVRRPSDPLPVGLQNFEKNRKAKVKQKLSENFGINCTDASVPKIGFCLSGGGFRAMLAGLGFLSGADKIGLFDCAMYNAGLSGGTWALGPASWMQLKKGMNIQDYKEKIIKNIDYGVPTPAPGVVGPPFVEYPASDVVAENYVKRMAWDQKITSIDLWGPLVGNVVLQGADGWSLKKKGKRLKLTFSELADDIEDGSMPLPLISAARPSRSVSRRNVTGYRWFSFNPFESGTHDVGGYIPTWAVGRKFSGGKTTRDFRGYAPEYPFSYFLGVAGSAFSINLKFLYDDKLPSFKAGPVKISIPKAIVNARFMPCEINNYLRGLPGNDLGSKGDFVLVDAGIAFNLPMPLLLNPEPQRSDIIFMFDASTDLVKPFSDKDPIYRYMTESTKALYKGLPKKDIHITTVLELLNQYNETMNKGVLPHFDPRTGYYMHRHGAVMAVFNDPRKDDYNPAVPVCLFLPVIKNPKYTTKINGTTDPEKILYGKNQNKNFMNTSNFKYSESQARWLSGLTEQNIIDVKDEIKAVIAAWVAKNPGSTPPAIADVEGGKASA